MTANGEGDHLITPEGLKDYVVPPPHILDPSEAPASTNRPVTTAQPEEEEEEENETDEEDTEPSEDMNESELEMVDDSDDRDLTFGDVGKKMKIHYGNGWSVGKIDYYNTSLKKYHIVYKDGTEDYVGPEEIDDIDVMIVKK